MTPWFTEFELIRFAPKAPLAFTRGSTAKPCEFLLIAPSEFDSAPSPVAIKNMVFDSRRFAFQNSRGSASKTSWSFLDVPLRK